MDTLLVVMAVFGPGPIDAQPSNTIETKSEPIPTKQIAFFTAFLLLFYNSTAPNPLLRSRIESSSSKGFTIRIEKQGRDVYWTLVLYEKQWSDGVLEEWSSGGMGTGKDQSQARHTTKAAWLSVESRGASDGKTVASDN
jgi:hypothetical protein